MLILFNLLMSSSGQMIGLETPINSLGDGYYENFQTGFSFTKGNFFAFWNPQVVPPFGGYDPSADARLGFSGRGPGGGRFRFGLTMGQGSSRSNSVTSPSLVVPNGGGGSFINSTFQPFVTSFIPVVGDGGTPKTSIAAEILRALKSGETMESLLHKHGRSDSGEPLSMISADYQQTVPSTTRPVAASSAERGDISVAEIKRRQKMEAAADTSQRNAEFQRLMRDGSAAESSGNLQLARFSYRSATRKASGAAAIEAKVAFERVNQRIQKQREMKKLRAAAAKSKEDRPETND